MIAVNAITHWNAVAPYRDHSPESVAKDLKITVHDGRRKMAKTACLACRRLKMKCTGEVGSPCARCEKLGRECVYSAIVTPNRRARSVEESSLDAISSPGHQSHGDHQHLSMNGTGNSPGQDSTTDGALEENGVHFPASKRRRVHSSGQLGRSLLNLFTNGHQGQGVDERPIPARDMVELIYIFRERLISYIPVLCPDDFEDIPSLIQKGGHLSDCICYVTARYLPGGKAIRKRLFPAISRILRTKFRELGRDDDDNLRALQALLVLYAYTDSTSIFSKTEDVVSEECLLFWPLKGLIEAFAARLSLHRSVEDVQRAMNNREANIPKSNAYRSYTYWLYIYLMAQYWSTISATPPTIRADSSIRVAPALLHGLGPSPAISSLLASVELYLLWETATSQGGGFGEWWSVQDEPTALEHDSISASLHQTDAVFSAWSTKWRSFTFEDHILGVRLDFQFRFLQFCISTYPMRTLKISRTGLQPFQKELIRRCVTSAAGMLEWGMNLGPAGKDRLRYACDCGFVEISFCSLFILQACGSFALEFPEIVDSNLNAVADSAQLMIDLAVDLSHGPSIYGRYILANLNSLRETLRDAITSLGREDSNGGATHGTVEQATNSRMPEESARPRSGPLTGDGDMYLIDTVWDLSLLFPYNSKS